MRTKTLLCMAALAAGVATSMAQNVYSLNIVGYANVQCDSGFHAYSTPFIVGVSNGANEIFDNSTGALNDSLIEEWTGVGYNVSAFSDNTAVTTTGFANALGDTQKPVPILGGGKGWLFNKSGASNNIVFVGTVRTGTNNVDLAPFGAGKFAALGSPLPYAGPITSLGFTNVGGSMNDCQFLRLKTTTPTGGSPAGYDVTVWSDNTAVSTTGFVNNLGDTQKPEPQVAIGQGFLYLRAGASPSIWTQILNP
jgi:hypothetical protein